MSGTRGDAATGAGTDALSGTVTGSVGGELGVRSGGGQVALVDLLDRLLAGGVVLSGEVTISLAEIDLIHISLRALISSVATLTGDGASSAEDGS
jgi:Gas vesicle protein